MRIILDNLQEIDFIQIICEQLNSIDGAMKKSHQLPKFSSFLELLSYRNSTQPNKLAYRFLQDGIVEQDNITYGELDRRSKKLAAKLQSLGMSGKRALLLYPSGIDYIVAFFGCLYAGTIAVTAYPPRNQRHRPRIEAIATDAKIAIALTTSSHLSKIQSLLARSSGFENVRWLATDNCNDISEKDWQKPKLNTDSLAFLQYTSGSTGKPKGVMVSHGNILHNSALIYQYFGHTPHSNVVSWLPMYHDMGLIGGILQPLYGGFPVTLMSPEDFLKKPLNWLQAISKYKATTSGGPNFAYDFCVSRISPEQMVNLDLSTWEVAFNGSEPIRAETLEKFIAKFVSVGFRADAFYPCYGMAESTLLVSGASKNEPPVIKNFDLEALSQNKIVESFGANSQKIVGCGQIKFNQKVKIVNPENFTIFGDQEVGEIWVQSESVAKGYWQQKEATEKTFLAHTIDTKEGKFLRTGDLGFIQDGELFITGRLKDLIIIRGRNYYPQDIEITVEKSHPALRSSCGSAFEVQKEDRERLVVVQEIERTYRNKLNVDEVFTAIRQAVSEEQELTVHAVVLIKTATIPKTSSGKIQRRAVRQKFLEDSLEVVASWQEKTINSSIKKENQAQTIEEWLVDRLAREIQINLEEIDVKEPFSSYGINSVKAVSIVGELEIFLDRSLSATLLYDYPSIESLTRYLTENSTSNEYSAIESKKLAKETEVIAIIGIGCRFPQAKNPQAFWELLRNGIDAISEMPLNESRSKMFEQANNKRGGFLEGVDLFDPEFFGISPREAEQIDPQQRLLLEISWEALENASIRSQHLVGTNTGVFIGISNYDYGRIQNLANTNPNVYSGTGNAFSIAANRLSYILDLRGPSIAIDTACSSSLVAVHQACQSLRQNECDLALAGGVNLILSPDVTETFSLAGMLAADDRCKTFDADADGYVRGEGCGIIVLKRLEDAVRNKDNILAVIKGSAINQDGRSNGLTAPNGLSQQKVINQALFNAGVKADRISYIEAHGTGTSLGDPIELNALKKVLLSDGSLQETCWVGSVKTNIGHLEAAAGIAGLIKVLLALKHGEIPPHLNFNKLNPHISLENTPLKIPTKLTSWSNETKLAGVSSFGFGGTNAHIVLESAPNLVSTVTKQERPYHIFTLSAKSDRALLGLVQKYRQFLESQTDICLADVCFNANTGRSHFDHRLAIVVESSEQLLQNLKAFEAGENVFQIVTDSNRPQIAFLFTGQGSQYVGMGRQLYQTQPTFRREFDRCEEILRPYLEKPLLEIIFQESGVRSQKSGVPQSPEFLLNQTAYTQPAIFALEYALASLWMSWGIKPNAVMGHSLGEYVAATIAGVFSLEDALKLIVDRARLIQSLPQNGSMVAVFAELKQVEAAIEPYRDNIAIAAFNGLENIVISGETEAVKSAIDILEARAIKTKNLQVSHAFHSPLIEPIMGEFAAIASKVTYNSPQITLISNLTGQQINDEITTAEYWVNHLRQPVRFLDSINTLEREGYTIFLEIGAKPILLGMGSRCLSDRNALWLPSIRPQREDWQQILESLGQLYRRGIEIDWAEFDRDYTHNKITLPTYAFQRKPYWLETSENNNLNTQQRSTSIWQLLEGGNTEQLSQKLEETGEFFPEQVKLLPKLLEVLAKQHQKELDKASINELLYQVQWQLLEAKNDSVNAIDSIEKSERWLIFADSQGIGKSLGKAIQKLGYECELVYPAENYSHNTEARNYYLNPYQPEQFKTLFKELFSTNKKAINKIVHLWSLEAEATEKLTISALEKAQALGCGSVLHLVQTLSQKEKFNRGKLWLITRNACSVNNTTKSLAIAQKPLWGFGKAISLENSQLWGGLIDLDVKPSSNEIEMLLGFLQTNKQEDQIAFRDEGIYVARLARQTFAASKPLKLNSDATYLITGGLGALGLQIAQWMVEEGAKNLVLLSRRQPDDRLKSILESLETKGANIAFHQADVSNYQQLERVFKEIKADLPPLRGIVHAAGIIDDSLLAKLTWERFVKVLSPKLKGGWNLHCLSQQLSLDFFSCFSSAASLIGSVGQGNYAAANAFLDGLAHYRYSLGMPGVSLNWGPWGDVGMAASLAKIQQKRLQDFGVSQIAPKQGLQVLEQILSQQIPQIGILKIDWQIFLEKISNQTKQLKFLELVAKIELKSEEKLPLAQKPELLNKIKSQKLSNKRVKILREYLQEKIALLLKLDRESKLLDPERGLFDMGMDSLMAIELKNSLENDLGIVTSSTLAFEFPTITGIAQYLEQKICDDFYSNDRQNNVPEQELSLAQIRWEIEQLSQNEVEASIATEIVKLENLLGGKLR